MSAVRIAKTIEFDAGHRVATHDGQCRSPHGHRYRVECVFEGVVPDSGMVEDFGWIKTMLMDSVHARFDHAMIVDSHDALLVQAMAAVPTWKTAILDRPPTAENIALAIGATVEARLQGRDAHHVQLREVTVWETPTSRATVSI